MTTDTFNYWKLEVKQ